MGENHSTMLVIFFITSATPAKNFCTVPRPLSSGIRVSAKPNSRAKKMHCSRLALLMEEKMLVGMMPSRVSRMFIFLDASAVRPSVLMVMPLPTASTLATTRPIRMATAVVTMKIRKVRPARLPSFFMSPTSAAAVISRLMTSGTTTMFSRLVRMVPRNLSSLPASGATIPRTIPAIKPIRIQVNRPTFFSRFTFSSSLVLRSDLLSETKNY